MAGDVATVDFVCCVVEGKSALSNSPVFLPACLDQPHSNSSVDCNTGADAQPSGASEYQCGLRVDSWSIRQSRPVLEVYQNVLVKSNNCSLKLLWTVKSRERLTHPCLRHMQQNRMELIIDSLLSTEENRC